jgi:hypothetical protein
VQRVDNLIQGAKLTSDENRVVARHSRSMTPSIYLRGIEYNA